MMAHMKAARTSLHYNTSNGEIECASCEAMRIKMLEMMEELQFLRGDCST